MKVEISRVDDLLRREDIEGYIELGAPDDEYSSEAEQIAAALGEAMSEQLDVGNIASIISLVWIRNFNLSESDVRARMSAIERVAEEIQRSFKIV